MKHKITMQAVLISLLLVALISGCSSPTPTVDVMGTVQVNVAVAQTAAVLQTGQALTLTAVQAAIPTDTPTPGPTNTITPTATPDVMFMTLSKATYCRKGELSSSPSVALLPEGQTVEVVAINPFGDTYYVIYPAGTTSRCWLWGGYATFSGAQPVLPIYTSVPTAAPTNTPKPAADFTITYTGKEICGADFYFRFNIVNSGDYTLESWLVNVTDATNNTSTSHSNTSFTDYAACAAGFSQSDLTPGESGVVAVFNPGQVAYNPTGHNFTATFTLCQMDTYGGCSSKTISFIP